MRTLVLGAMVIALAGCDSAAKQVEKRRVVGQEKVRAVAALATKSLPRVTGSVERPSRRLASAGLGGNTLIASGDAIARLGASRSTKGQFLSVDSSIEEAASWMSGVKPEGVTAEQAKMHIDELLAIEYVVIVTATSVRKPSRYNDTPLMIPGAASGEAHLFDVAGKHYGAVTWSATSSQQVEATTSLQLPNGQKVDIDPQISMDSDLESQSRSAVRQALAAALPDATSF